MFYDFICPKDGRTGTVSRPMSESGNPVHCLACGTQCTRVYGDFQKIIMLDQVDYIEKAYHGEELPGGMSQQQVQKIVDSQYRTRRGRTGNSGKYGKLSTHGGTH